MIYLRSPVVLGIVLLLLWGSAMSAMYMHERNSFTKYKLKAESQALKASEDYRKLEQDAASRVDAVATAYEQEKLHGDDLEARLVAAGRAGTVRVRSALCPRVVPSTAASTGQPDAAPESGVQLAIAAVRVGFDCDAQVRALQALVRADRETK